MVVEFLQLGIDEFDDNVNECHLTDVFRTISPPNVSPPSSTDEGPQLGIDGFLAWNFGGLERLRRCCSINEAFARESRRMPNALSLAKNMTGDAKPHLHASARSWTKLDDALEDRCSHYSHAPGLEEGDERPHHENFKDQAMVGIHCQSPLRRLSPLLPAHFESTQRIPLPSGRGSCRRSSDVRCASESTAPGHFLQRSPGEISCAATLSLLPSASALAEKPPETPMR